MHEYTVHLLACQKKLEDEYKDFNVLLKINKSDMAGTLSPSKSILDCVMVS